jgi:hypothetical protein
MQETQARLVGFSNAWRAIGIGGVDADVLAIAIIMAVLRAFRTFRRGKLAGDVAGRRLTRARRRLARVRSRGACRRLPGHQRRNSRRCRHRGSGEKYAGSGHDNQTHVVLPEVDEMDTYRVTVAAQTSPAGTVSAVFSPAQS